MSKLWGGRFAGENDRAFARFNASLRFDRRLMECDVRVSLAHLQALRQAGALTEAECGRIGQAVLGVLDRVQADPGLIDAAVAAGVEDVHSFLENEVVKEVGEIGLKLNTGRSRNDQVATDFRIFVREAIDATSEGLTGVQRALLDLAEVHPEVALPGYTHLQRAQPVLFAHYLLAYFEMLDRDRHRLADCRKRVNLCPLGSGALAGTNYPLDRNLEAKLLGFDGITANSLDAVSDRDFTVEFCAAGALILSHLSRLSEDMVLYASAEFAFLELGDSVTTGSSLMPQKKNPDGLELIRGKSGRVVGNLVALLTLLKGLPLTYNKDLQEDKEPLFDSLDTLLDCLQVMEIVLRNTRVHATVMMTAATTHHMNATELADYLVGRGLAFRVAHEVAGRVVLEALQHGIKLEELSLEEFRKHSPLIEEDVYEAISLARTLAAKDVPGGTAPDRVRDALADARRRLGSEFFKRPL